jgi:plasmid maintenance system antidote protein VapI
MSRDVFSDGEIHQIKIMREYGLGDAEIANILEVTSASKLREIYARTEAVNEGISKSTKAAIQVVQANDNTQVAA